MKTALTVLCAARKAWAGVAGWSKVERRDMDIAIGGLRDALGITDGAAAMSLDTERLLMEAYAEIERLRASERSLSERIVNMSDQYETLHAEFERLRADNARLESAFSDCAENAEAWHQKAERLRAALKPFATAAICAIRTSGDKDEGMGLWMPMKFLDAARDALADEQSAQGTE